MYVFRDRSFGTLIMLSFPSYNSSTTPMFRLPPRLSSIFIISNCYFHMPSLVFHIAPFSKRTRVLFVSPIPGCVLATFDISLPLLNYFVTIIKLFFWYSNLLSFYQNVRCQYRKLNIVIYIHQRVDCLSLSLCPLWLLVPPALRVLISQLIFINIALLPHHPFEMPTPPWDLA